MKLLLSNNKISAGFKPFRDLITSENKHFATAPLLGIILFACAFVVFRACGLFFEADDFRFLWWAFDRQAEPWKAFTDPPLFANYYRPVVSLLWWVHYQLFGVNEYMHHLALGFWWTAIFVLCFFWNQRKENSLSGFLACVILFSSWAMHDLIQWKSWLTTISSLVLHLSALTVLLHYNKNATRLKLAFFIFLFLAASWAKESARFTILFTSLALVLGSTELKRPNKYKLSVLIGILWLVLFFTSSAVKGYAFSFSQFFFDFRTTIPNISYYADVILGNTYVKVFAFIAVSLALLGDGWRHLWRIGLSAFGASLLFC
ncbi:hypothetical protein GF373_07950, partial [bacterium]|nr:hypothetical protein [bacterium]